MSAANTCIKSSQEAAEVLPAQVSLDQLPFPAAVVNRDAVISAVNPPWLTAHPATPPGIPLTEWSGELCGAAAEPADALSAGVRQVLDGSQPAFMQTLEDRRIVVLPSPAGALILHEELDS